MVLIDVDKPSGPGREPHFCMLIMHNMRVSLAVAAACLASLLALASAQQSAGLQLPDWAQQKVAKIKQYCSKTDFRSRPCAWADDTEVTLTGQCLGCGTAYYGNVGRRQLPLDFSDFSGSAAYKMAYGLPSLACQGKAVVRSVFKQNRMDWDRPGCADFRLHPDGDSGAKSPEVVRCELALPSGGGSENERALRSKEVNCRICTLCRDGGGCPNVPGKWYSDSFVVDLAGGCGASPAALARYGSDMPVLVLNPGIKVQLAKFEVCQRPGCFDPAYEAAKLRGAKRCVKGKC